jgi:hypothetical protein
MREDSTVLDAKDTPSGAIFAGIAVRECGDFRIQFAKSNTYYSNATPALAFAKA